MTEYAIRQFVDPLEMKADLAISTANLSDAMIQQASLFSKYGVLASEASHQVDVVKMLLESTEATVYKLLRDEAVKAGDKVTEAQLEKMVARHSSVTAMKRSLNAAKRIEAQAKTALEAFRHKKDMLVQLGAISREELKGELTIAARNTHESLQKEVMEQKTNRAAAVAEALANAGR